MLQTSIFPYTSYVTLVAQLLVRLEYVDIQTASLNETVVPKPFQLSLDSILELFP